MGHRARKVTKTAGSTCLPAAGISSNGQTSRVPVDQEIKPASEKPIYWASLTQRGQELPHGRGARTREEGSAPQPRAGTTGVRGRGLPWASGTAARPGSRERPGPHPTQEAPTPSLDSRPRALGTALLPTPLWTRVQPPCSAAHEAWGPRPTCPWGHKGQQCHVLPPRAFPNLSPKAAPAWNFLPGQLWGHPGTEHRDNSTELTRPRGQWGSQQRQGAGQAGPQEPSHHPLQAHHSSSFQQRGPALAEATRSPMSECAQAPSTQEFSSTSQEAEDLPGAGRGEGAERAGTCQCQPRRLCSQALNEA